MFNTIFRPTTFEDVVGNKAVVDAIKNSIEAKKTGHKIFISGPYGVGKTTLARIIAMHLRDVSSQKELDKDISYNEIDCSRFGNTEYVRQFVERLEYSPYDNKPAVYVFDECARMSPAAQNVLLKPIEDSKDYNVFIFVTSEPERMIEMLMDRFTHRKLEPLTKTDILRNLERVCRILNVNVEKCVLIDIAFKSGGHIRQSLVLIEDFIKMSDRQKQDYLEVLSRKKTGQNNCQNSSDNGENHEDPEDNEPEIALEISESDASPDEQTVTDLTSDSPIITNNPNSDSSRYLEAITRAAFSSTALINTDCTGPRSFMAPFINEGSLTMIYAVAGVGKSWLSQLIAILLTRAKYQNIGFGSFRVVEQCGTVIIDAELSNYELKQRLSMLANPLGEENPLAPLTIVTSEGIVNDLDVPMSLDDENWRKSIYLYMKNNPQNKVLVLDNLSSLCGGHSESSREAITPINRWLLSLKRLGLAVILIHHSNKAGGYRGHSSRIDNLDTVLSLKRLKDTDQLHFAVNFEKARTAKPGEAKSFVLEAKPHPDNADWLTWNWYDENTEDAPSNSKNDKIMAYLMLHKVTQQEVAKHFDVSQATVSNCRRKAIYAGYLTKEGEITDAGRQFIEELGIEPDDDGVDIPE